MKKTSMRWVAASALAAIFAAACSNTDNTTGTGGMSGAGGAGATSGAGGANDAAVGADSAPACVQSAGAGMCEMCAFSDCQTEVCDCKANAGCAAALGDYLACMEGGSPDTCATALVLGAGNAGADVANTFATCMTDIDSSCVGSCVVADAGTGG